jgi:hypothetical protein
MKSITVIGIEHLSSNHFASSVYIIFHSQALANADPIAQIIMSSPFHDTQRRWKNNTKWIMHEVLAPYTNSRMSAGAA